MSENTKAETAVAARSALHGAAREAREATGEAMREAARVGRLEWAARNEKV